MLNHVDGHNGLDFDDEMEDERIETEHVTDNIK